MNHLTTEHSLYLKQHADNPVDWYPWGAGALDKAKVENKPILLSIGYSACHWCHVMASESFADPVIAKIMNEHFVNVKVDREERPDLDKIYQLAQQLLTGHGGGWPLTMFLTPDDQTPFFGGTYFPPVAQHGMPAFGALLQEVSRYFHAHPGEIKTQNSRLLQALQELALPKKSETTVQITDAPLKKARQDLGHFFDSVHGGFGSAPKFPQTTSLEFLLRYWSMSKASAEDTAAFQKVEMTLTKMAHGGIYDQIGGGFYRYSVDGEWQIPHFEKMLYDNAQLLGLYAQMSMITYEPLFTRITQETAEWLMREMRSPENVYYATLDADSEHEEGKFYYWDREQIKNLLTADEFKVVAHYFNLEQTANFEHHWHLHVSHDLTAATPSETLLHSAQQKLLAARNTRIRPGRDEKILTAWNSLLLKNLTLAGQALQRDDLILAAQQILAFIKQNLWRNNALFASYQNQQAHLSAYLDDYAFLIDAVLTLLQVRWSTEDLQFAITLADSLLAKFADPVNGGFFFTANDHETLIQRPQVWTDDALPSGNSVAALALARLGHLLGETRYLDACRNALTANWSSLMTYPTAHANLLIALEEYLYPPQLIILRGTEQQLPAWQAICQQDHIPNRLAFAIPTTENNLPGMLMQYMAKNNNVTAYVCQGQQCLPPIIDLERLREVLK